jgi:cell division protein FtsB
MHVFSKRLRRVYVVIRIFIRVAEYVIARPKHRRLRRMMQEAETYAEWYAYAAELDKSQKRDRWLRQEADDLTSQRYNWGFIRELIKDLKRARATGDSLLALAVLQQCTRKVVWRRPRHCLCLVAIEIHTHGLPF